MRLTHTYKPTGVFCSVVSTTAFAAVVNLDGRQVRVDLSDLKPIVSEDDRHRARRLESSIADARRCLAFERAAHEFNLDVAQRELDRRNAEGEPVDHLWVNPRTARIEVYPFAVQGAKVYGT